CGTQDVNREAAGDDPMNKDWKVLHTVLQAHGGKVGEGSVNFVSWLRENKVPDSLASKLAKTTLRKNVYVGAVSFYSEKDIISVNSEGGIPIALKGRLLIVGSGPNGDPLAIDVQDQAATVGFISAGEMWSAKDIRKVFLPVASVGKFAEGLSKDTMPSDYF